MKVCSNLVDKKKLEKHRARREELCELAIEISNLDDILKSVPGSKISDMPRSQNPTDRIGNLLSDKLEKEKRHSKLSAIICEEEAIIESIFDKMLELPERPKGPTNRQLRDVLRYFYIYCFGPEMIIKIFHLRDIDFDDTKDNKVRNLYRWQEKALSKFIKCQISR